MVVLKTVISTVDVILGMLIVFGANEKKNRIIAAVSSLLVVGLNLFAIWN